MFAHAHPAHEPSARRIAPAPIAALIGLGLATFVIVFSAVVAATVVASTIGGLLAPRSESAIGSPSSATARGDGLGDTGQESEPAAFSRLLAPKRAAKPEEDSDMLAGAVIEAAPSESGAVAPQAPPDAAVQEEEPADDSVEAPPPPPPASDPEWPIIGPEVG